MDLTERKKRILRAIIESYIQSAEPVGSKAIAASIDMEVSSATIRNEMADLEAMGLLEKPHTSAGRIPSPKGYRLYVNELMEEHKLSLQETQRINQALAMRMRELDRVLDQAGRVVSQLTNYPSFALSSGLSRMTIRRFDLLMVERNAFIIVVMTDTDIVRNRLIRLPSDLTEAQLQMLNTLLNTTFTGLTLEEITPELMRVAQHAAGEAYGLISLVVSFAMEVLESLEQRTVHTSGLAHLLELPEYRSLERELPLRGRRPCPLPRSQGRSHEDPHRPGKRGRRAEGHQRGGRQLRHRRRHAGCHRRGWAHPDGLRQDNRPPVLSGRGPLPAVWTG